MDNDNANFSITTLKKAIIEIEKTETKMWNAHKAENIKQVFLLCLERASFVEDNLDKYREYTRHMTALLSEILERYKQVKEVVFNNNYHRILLCLEELLVVTSKQAEELNVSNKLIDFDQRTLILNGDKIKEYESEFTSVCSKLIEEIDKSTELDTSYQFEERMAQNQEEYNEQTIEEVELTTEYKEINETYEKEEIVHEKISDIDNNLVELKTKKEETVPVEIEVERTEEEVNTNEDTTIPLKEDSKDTSNFNEFDYKVAATPIEEKSYFTDTSKKDTNENKEIENVILEHFSYQDSPTLSDEEKEEIKSKSVRSNSAKKYAQILIDLEKGDELEIYEMLARKLFAQTLMILQESNIEPLPYSMSQTWVMWDIAKQLYYIKNPLEANEKYTLENPLESESKQKEIIYRHIGWIVYKEMTSGKLDNLLANIKNSSYAKKIIDYMIDKPNHEGGTLSSYKLADLGKSVILSLTK
jgi:hypothetical protein